MEVSDPKASRLVIGLGEVLWDCFESSGEQRPGGAPSNVAFHAQQLGLRGIICSRVGQDALGNRLLAYLRDHSLDTDSIQRDPDRPTSTVTVHDKSAKGPSYTIHEDVAWDALDFTDRWETLHAAAAAVCFGTLAQRTEKNRQTIRRCLQAAEKALKVYDVNLRPPHLAPAWIESSLLACDVMKLNIDEVAALGPLLGLAPGEPTVFARTVIHQYKVSAVVITQGDEGCLVVSGKDEVSVPGRRVNVVDTVGAGDSFSAGIIYGMLSGWDLGATARLANALAARVAGRPGAMPDLGEELDTLKSEFSPEK